MKKNFQQILTSFQNEGKEDYIGLWQVETQVRLSLGLSKTDTKKLLQEVLGFVRLMLQNRFIAVTLAKGGGYTAWPDQSPESVTKKIEQEWNRLGGPDPDLTFSVWFCYKE
jgi:hypothetical protein